jgi:vacuolar-type H+-ATPase subunit H
MAAKEENEELVNKILRGLEKSYKDLLASKKRNNEDLIILRNDRIVRIKP